MKRKKRPEIDVLWNTMTRVEHELMFDEMSDRKRKAAQKFLNELIDELNYRAEEIVAEKRYIEDVDAGRVMEVPRAHSKTG